MQLKKEADYLEEYTISPNSKGKRLVYHGPVFLFRGDEREFRVYRRNALIADLMQLILLTVISLLDPYALRGQGVLLFALFYIGSVFSAAYVLYTSVCFCFSRRELNRKTYDRCVVNRNLGCLILAPCMAVCTGAQAWCIVAYGLYRANEPGVLLLLLLGLLLCGWSLYQRKRHGFDRQANADPPE